MQQNALRFHDEHTELFHLLYPTLILLLESRNIWPLIFSPKRLRLVRILHRTIIINGLVIIRLPIGNILLQSRISFK